MRELYDLLLNHFFSIHLQAPIFTIAAAALTELALAREREALSAARLEATQRELASLRGRTLELEAERDRLRITRTSTDRLDRYKSYTRSESHFMRLGRQSALALLLSTELLLFGFIVHYLFR